MHIVTGLKAVRVRGVWTIMSRRGNLSFISPAWLQSESQYARQFFIISVQTVPQLWPHS